MNTMTEPEEKLSKSERKYRNQRLMMIRAAKRLFEKKPYDDVNMEDIADEAAVSKQTLYNYFSSKDSIYLGIGIEGFKEAIKSVNELSLAATSGRKLVLKLIGIFFDAATNFPLSAEVSRRFIIINNEMDGIAEKTLQARKKEKQKQIEKKRDIEEVLADYLEQVWRYEEVWKGAIRKGKEDGTISSNLNENQLMYYVSIFINGVSNQMQLQRKPIMTALKRRDLNYDRIKEITLHLVENLFEYEI